MQYLVFKRIAKYYKNNNNNYKWLDMCIPAVLCQYWPKSVRRSAARCRRPAMPDARATRDSAATVAVCVPEIGRKIIIDTIQNYSILC